MEAEFEVVIKARWRGGRIRYGPSQDASNVQHWLREIVPNANVTTEGDERSPLWRIKTGENESLLFTESGKFVAVLQEVIGMRYSLVHSEVITTLR